jgi:hypothetical protein
MKKLLVLAPCIAILSACGGGGAGGGAVSLQPGQWETTMQFTNSEAPGAPEPQVAAMRQAMGQPQTRNECMTPAQAANPAAGMMNAGGGGNSCNFTKSTFANGTIDVAGTCSPPGGANATVAMTGTYTATTMTAQVTTTVRAPAGTPGPQEIRMTGNVNARRTGDCAAGAAGNTQ